MVAKRFWLQAFGKNFARRLGRAIALVGVGLVSTTRPAVSAEEVIITYGFLERTVSVEELTEFARGGELSPQLRQYARSFRLTETEIEAIRQVLNRPVDLNEVELAQFLYTTQGETLLELFGEVIQTPSRRSGFFAIRSAIILAAANDEQGLTLLNFLQEYPTPAIRVDVGRGLQIARTVTETLNRSERAINLVQALSDEAAAGEPDEAILAAWRLINTPAPYNVVRRSLVIPGRNVPATLFVPQSTSQRLLLPDDIPVIVISHGLGDQRESYDYLANYLAERGFFVATLDHPGSNSEQIEDLLSGISPNVVDNQEFLNRPEDVSALLDEIEQFALRNPIFRRRLNLQNVGVIGQSFGGYTALALAGATFNPDSLAAACEPSPSYLNPSLLLQCQAMGIADARPPLEDARVQAILVVNPVGSALFGQSGYEEIPIPVLIVAATGDTVAPALPEQIRPFTWLQTPDRYLALVSNTTHFSYIAGDPNASSIPLPSAVLGPNPELAQNYLKILSLAFFQRHLRQDSRFEAALTANYLQEYVAQPPLQPFSFVQELSSERLEQALAGN